MAHPHLVPTFLCHQSARRRSLHGIHLHDDGTHHNLRKCHHLNYLSRYNMATMVTNNSKLLSTKDKSQKKAELVERLMEMDQEKLEAMLKLMG